MKTAKKLLAVLLSLSVMLSCMLISGVVASAEVSFWDGTTTQPVDSDSDGVYEINNAAELAWVAQNNTGESYILTADIYVNDMAVKASGSGATLTKLDGSAVDTASLKTWVTTTGDSDCFSGTLDGNGHTISGLYNVTQDATAASTSRRGLFGLAHNPTIKNLRLTNVYFSGGTYGGALIGRAPSGTMVTIDNCYVENASIATNITNVGGTFPATGGLVGYIQNCGLTVKNTAVVDIYLANTVQASRVGSFLADGWATGNITVTNSYAATSYAPFGSGTSNASAYKGTMSATNFYSTTATTGTVAPQATTVSVATGQTPAVTMYGLGENFYTTDTYPLQAIFFGDGELTAANKQLGTAPYEGSGTEADPYLIKDAEDLRNAVGTYGMSYWYELTNDIYLNDVDKIDWKTGEVADGYTANEWFVSSTDISGYNYNGFAGQGCFNGKINGKGYSIHGLYVAKESLSNVTGLVPVAANTTIKNLAIENSYIAGARLNGGFMGYSYNNNVIDCCLVTDTVTIVGYNGGNAYFQAAYEKQTDGQPNGQAASPFSGTIANGVKYESCATGGIIGYANKTATVTDCAVYGDVRSLTEDELFTTTNAATNGGEPVTVEGGTHLCGIIGTGWNSTITMTDNVSLVQTHDKLSGSAGNFTTVCENNYSVAASQDCCTAVTTDDITGAEALDTLTGLDADVWTATSGYPVPSVFTCLNTTAHADDHDWTEWAETTAPGCNSKGEETRECVVCGKDDSRDVDPSGHDKATEWSKDAAGHWYACANCTDKLDYAAHTYDQQVEESAYEAGKANCDEAATYYYSCVCGAKGTETFTSGQPNGHSPKTEWAHDDLSHWHRCNNCTALLNVEEHRGGEATCSAMATCEICGTPYGNIDEDNHDLDEVSATTASHDEDGNIKHYECVDCGKLFDDENGTNELEPEDVIIDGGDHDFGDEYEKDKNGHWQVCECGGKTDVSDHDYGEWKVTKEETATGEKERTCSVCGYVDTATIPVSETHTQTGDTANTLPWIAVAMVSVMTLAVIAVRKRKA